MELSAFFAFLHHVAAFAMAGALLTELILLRLELTLQSARALLRVDMIYGLSALTLLVVGPIRVLLFEKGPEYYLHSIPFLVKIITFAVVGLLSIIPTGAFLAWRKGLREGIIPIVAEARVRRLRTIVHLELLGVAVIIGCAVLMARGIGSRMLLY